MREPASPLPGTAPRARTARMNSARGTTSGSRRTTTSACPDIPRARPRPQRRCGCCLRCLDRRPANRRGRLWMVCMGSAVLTTNGVPRSLACPLRLIKRSVPLLVHRASSVQLPFLLRSSWLVLDAHQDALQRSQPLQLGLPNVHHLPRSSVLKRTQKSGGRPTTESRCTGKSRQTTFSPHLTR